MSQCSRCGLDAAQASIDGSDDRCLNHAEKAPLGRIPPGSAGCNRCGAATPKHAYPVGGDKHFVCGPCWTELMGTPFRVPRRAKKPGVRA